MWRAQLRKSFAGAPHWSRIAEESAKERYYASLDRASMDGAGISHAGGPGWRSWTEFNYPVFDLCAPPDDLKTFDLVSCEHVLEHVVDPITATKTLYRMLRPGGHLIVVTPFLVKIHKDPIDLWRFTPDGMRILLEQAGFKSIEVGAWGNAIAVSANFRVFVRDEPWVRRLRRWTLSNNPATPVAVWAFARR